MDGLKKLLIGNKLNLLTTARILTECYREKVQSKSRIVDSKLFLGFSRRGSVNIAQEEPLGLWVTKNWLTYIDNVLKSRGKGTSFWWKEQICSLCRASVKRSCSEIWEVTDQQISTGLDFLLQISTDFFLDLSCGFCGGFIKLQVWDEPKPCCSKAHKYHSLFVAN